MLLTRESSPEAQPPESFLICSHDQYGTVEHGLARHGSGLSANKVSAKMTMTLLRILSAAVRRN